MRRTCSLVVSALAGLCFAPAAFTATASVIGEDLDHIEYRAEPGEANAVTITQTADASASSRYEITDAGATISAGDGCTAVSAHEVECVADTRARLSVRLGDSDDSFSSLLLPARCVGCLSLALGGGGGNDTLAGGPTVDVLHGGAGDDALRGGGAADRLWGGRGDDRLLGGEDDDWLHGGGGADVFRGGPGSDWVRYAGTPGPVAVTLDGAAGDGHAGEGDNVRSDVEVVSGTYRSDTLVGNGGGNDLLGERGHDKIIGRGGNDHLFGDWGIDRLVGGRGRDMLDGSRGRDILLARDGVRDSVFGGVGSDRARIDRGIDRVLSVERRTYG